MRRLEDLSREAADIVQEVGGYIRKEARSFSATDIEVKGLHDLVSYVDKEAERRLVQGLSVLLPEAGFITEEQTVSQEEGQYTWIIDPLDGTTNFMHGIPVYSISVALRKGSELVLGIVYAVEQSECFLAWKGGGCFLNGQLVRVSPQAEMDAALLATGFPFRKFNHLQAYTALFQELMQTSRGIRRLGSAAIDLAYVACGRFDAFFEYNLQDYDIAAGIVLIREAGGLVCDFTGGDDMLENGSIVAGNTGISPQLLHRISNHFTDFGNHAL